MLSPREDITEDVISMASSHTGGTDSTARQEARSIQMPGLLFLHLTLRGNWFSFLKNNTNPSEDDTPMT